MSEAMPDLAARQCRPQEGGSALPSETIASLLARLPEWRVEGDRLCRNFRFPDHYATMAFVNAVAWISHRQDHHPDLSVGYNTCRVAYATHAVGGLSENDFICAAKVDALSER